MPHTWTFTPREEASTSQWTACVYRAGVDQLYSSLSECLLAMLHCGTTLVEAKSGYGLDFDNEYKMLEVIERAKRKHPISVLITYCGAHAMPK